MPPNSPPANPTHGGTAASQTLPASKKKEKTENMDKEKIGEWIDRIITDLVNPEIKLEDTLRKTNVLAFQIKNDKLKEWVNFELIGYDNYDQVPKYRTVPSEVRGTLIQQNFGRIITRKDVRLPIELLDTEAHDVLSSFNIAQSIAEIESLIREKKGGHLQVNLPVQVTSIIQRKIENFHIDSAWRVISTDSVVGVISNLKNQLLNFLLELNEGIGSDKSLSIMDKKDKVDEIFRKTIGNITGENINISFGEKSIQSTTNDNASTEINQNNNIVYGDEELINDLKDLLKIFRKLEAESNTEIEDIDEIKGELTRIEVQSNKEKPKRNIVKQSLEVLKTMAINIASNASTDTVVNKITEIIKLIE